MRPRSPGGTPTSRAAIKDFKAKEDAQNRLDAALADHARFDRLKAIKSAKLAEPTLARQIDVLYLLYLEKQVDPELLKQITAKANAIEKAFNGYRATVSGRQYHRQRGSTRPQRIT